MAVGDDPSQARTEEALDAEPAPEPSAEVEELRRSLARGGRPRVGRRFDAVMQTAKAKQPEPGAADERVWVAPGAQAPRQDQLPRWVSPGEQAGDGPEDTATNASTDTSTNPLTDTAADTAASPAAAPHEAAEPPVVGRPPESSAGPEPEARPTGPGAPSVEVTGEHLLRPDELVALRAGARQPTHVADHRVLGIAWPPHAAMVFLVAVIAVLAFGLGMVTGALRRPAPSAAPAQTVAAPTVPAPTEAPPTVAAADPPVTAPAPNACLDTARLGDRTINLLTADIRDRRLDEALRQYAAASRECRKAAERNR